MKVTDDELKRIYKVFARIFKEVGWYKLMKEKCTKPILLSLLERCESEKDFVDNLWGAINIIAITATSDDFFHGVRASLLYLYLILSDEFKNVYYHTFNKDGLKRLIEKERAYARSQVLVRDDLKMALLDNLSEIEYKMYMEFVSSDYVKYEGYL
jgi:hypothetical protein